MTSNMPSCPCCGAEISPLDLMMDEANGVVAFDGKVTRFPPAQFLLLKALINAYPTVLSKEQCFEALGDGYRDVDVKVVDVQICGIRKKADNLGLVITTLWGIGYRLELNETVKAEVLRNKRCAEGRKVRGAISAGDVAAVRMLRDQGYPLTDIARRLRLTFKAVSSALDLFKAEEDRKRDRTRARTRAAA